MSIKANEGVASLSKQEHSISFLVQVEWECENTDPFHRPLHAPVADPGLMKNLPSASNASNLSVQRSVHHLVTCLEQRRTYEFLPIPRHPHPSVCP